MKNNHMKEKQPHEKKRFGLDRSRFLSIMAVGLFLSGAVHAAPSALPKRCRLMLEEDFLKDAVYCLSLHADALSQELAAANQKIQSLQDLLAENESIFHCDCYLVDSKGRLSYPKTIQVKSLSGKAAKRKARESCKGENMQVQCS